MPARKTLSQQCSELISTLREFEPTAYNHIRNELQSMTKAKDRLALLQKTIDDVTLRNKLLQELRDTNNAAYDQHIEDMKWFEENDSTPSLQEQIELITGAINDAAMNLTASENAAEDAKQPDQIKVLRDEVDRTEEKRWLDEILKELDSNNDPSTIVHQEPLMQTKHTRTMSSKPWQRPQLYQGSTSLNAARNKINAFLNNFPKEQMLSVDKLLNDRAFYREHMQNMRRPVTQDELEDKIRFGKKGMGSNELQNLILDLKQDIKQIKEAQSVKSANNWINKHKWGDNVLRAGISLASNPVE